MKQLLVYAVLVTVGMLDFAKSTPATLCLYRACTNTGMACPVGAILQIRNGYYGKLSAARWRDLFNEKCSNDGIFCVRTVKDSGDVFVTYANRVRQIPVRDRHPPINDWCRDKPGVEYWFDV